MRPHTPPDETPEYWLRAYVRGADPAAAGRLFDVTAHDLFRVSLTLAPDAATAEDALQETYLAALEHAGRFEDGRPVLPWLLGILRRKIGRQRRAAARVPDPDRLAPPPPPVGPADSAVSHEERERVHAAIDALPEPYRGVAILRWRYGLEPAEIAHVRGDPPGTVRSLLHRAARKLEAALGALSAGLLPVAGRGLDALRARVVEAAGRLQPAPSVTTVSTGATAALLTGGMLMGTTQKVLLGAAALVVLILGGIGAWRLAAPATVTETTPGADTAGQQAADDADRHRVHMDDAPADEERGTRESAQVLPPPVDLAAADRDRDVHGRVTDKDGKPIAGAALEILRYPWRRASVLNYAGHNSGETAAEALSAADGTFSFRLRRGALVELSVEAEGFVPQTIAEVQAGERVDVALVAQRGGGVDLVVAVTEENDAPLEGATVRIFTIAGQPDARVNRRETTDAAGHARFGAVTPSVSLYADVTAEGHGDPAWVPFELPAEGKHLQLIRLPRGRTIRGMVSDAATGLPIAGALIGMNWVQRHAVRTGSDGRYELAGWTGKGTQEIAITADGYGRQRELVSERETIDMVLRRGDSVIGRLMGPGGEVVTGAFVTAIASRHDGRTQTTSFGHDVSAGDGRFTLTGLRRDLVHTLVVTAEGIGRTLLDFDPHAGTPGTIDLGDLTLSAGRSIEGIVTDAAGEPVPRIEVTLTGANHDRGRLRGRDAPSPDFHYGKTEQRRTDDLGRFRFPDLAPGTYTVAARPQGAPQRSTQIHLSDSDILDAEIRMARGRRVTVTVTGPDGELLEGVWVSAFGVPGQVNGQTDAQGQCVLTVEAARQVQISAFGGDGLADDLVQPSAQVLPPDAEELTFRFLRGHVLRARVLDQAGEPIAALQVEVHRGGKQETSALTDEEGRIAHKVAASGSVDLIVKGNTQRSEGRTVHFERLPLRGEARGVTPGSEEITIHCREISLDRTLTVRVTDPDGQPVEGMRVWSFDAGISWDTPLTTDATGTITLEGLPPDECGFVGYPAEGGLPEGWLAPAQVRVVADGQTIPMAFRRSVEVTGTVLDREGKPVVGAGVVARLEDGSTFNGSTESGGHFSLRVPEGAKPFVVTAVWATPGGGSGKATRTGVSPNTDIRLTAE